MRRFPRPVLLALAALTTLLLPTLLYARAGGGESFSGGGGGHGGGGGGGDGIWWLLFQLLRLCIYYPVVGIPIVLLIVGFFVYSAYFAKTTHQSSVIRRGISAADRREKDEVVAHLKASDPNFDETAFLARVRNAFFKIQDAWCGQNLADVRAFVSDGVHERFSLQFDEQRARGLRNKLDELSISDIELAHGYADAQFDVLSVRITASAVDTMVSLRDGKPLSGAGVAGPIAEVWTFLRRRGVTTPDDRGKPGLIEGNCPNCGGAIEMNQNANCQYCGAVLRSGQHDWVLAEITQDCEWRPGRPSHVPGVDALAERDPGFNVQALEDRASVVFWRLATAERLGDAKPLSKAALPSFIESYEQELRGNRAGDRSWTWYGSRGVGSVDTLGVLAGDMDRAVVEVVWSATRFKTDANGHITRYEQTAVSHLLLVLARSGTARTDTDKSVSSAHCPNCGAPESRSASGACDFCGVTLNDASRTWALEEAVPKTSQRGQQLRSQLRQAPAAVASEDADAGIAAFAASTPSADTNGHAAAPAATLAWMVKMTLADGHLDDRERAMLDAYATRYRVPAARVEALVAAAQAGTLDVTPPASDDDARATLMSLAKVALADGKIERGEASLLRAAGQRLGLSDHDVTQLLRRTRAQMYASGKQELRAARKARG